MACIQPGETKGRRPIGKRPCHLRLSKAVANSADPQGDEIPNDMPDERRLHRSERGRLRTGRHEHVFQAPSEAGVHLRYIPSGGGILKVESKRAGVPPMGDKPAINEVHKRTSAIHNPREVAQRRWPNRKPKRRAHTTSSDVDKGAAKACTAPPAKRRPTARRSASSRPGGKQYAMAAGEAGRLAA